MPSNTTLKDLAKRLGITPSTVSRALKGHPDISQATQECVRKLAKELNYAPDALARSLRSRRTNLIAIIIPDFSVPFYTQVLKGAAEIATEQGYHLIVFESHEDYQQEIRICHSLCKSGISGIMIAPTASTPATDHFREITDCKIKMVFFDRINNNFPADKVTEDYFGGAYAAVTHLIGGGCRKIIHLTGSFYLPSEQRKQQGYLKALSDHRITPDPKSIFLCRTMEDAITSLPELLRTSEADGIFTSNDWIAAGALHASQQMGLRVPEDISVCGFSGDPITTVTTPRLTTVELDGLQTGRVAADLLVKRLSGDDAAQTETLLLKTKLIIRDSSRITQV